MSRWMTKQIESSRPKMFEGEHRSGVVFKLMPFRHEGRGNLQEHTEVMKPMKLAALAVFASVVAPFASAQDYDVVHKGTEHNGT